MASTDKIALLELIRKIGLEDGDVDFLKEGLRVLTQAVIAYYDESWLSRKLVEPSSGGSLPWNTSTAHVDSRNFPFPRARAGFERGPVTN